MKKYLLMLVMAVAMVFATGSTVEAKTMTVTVKKADTSTLKKVNAHLKKGKKFYLKVKGSKSGSRKLIKSVSKKIGEINGYDVRFNYSGQKKSKKGYYRFTVSSENAKLYTNTVKLLTKMYTEERSILIRFWNENKEVRTRDENGNSIWSTEAGWDCKWETTSFETIHGGERFCDLSTLLQSEVIASCFNSNFTTYITYTSLEDMDIQGEKGYSDSKLISRLLKGQAKGVCGDFTRYQMLVFEQIGIPNYFTGNNVDCNHAIVTVKVKNSKGKIMWVCYDRGTPNTFKYNKDCLSNWKIEASSKINKQAYANTWDIHADWN